MEVNKHKSTQKQPSCIWKKVCMVEEFIKIQGTGQEMAAMILIG